MKSAARTLSAPGTCRALLAAVLLATGVHAHAGAADPALPGEVLVKLRTTTALETLLGKYQLGVIGQFGARPIYRLSLPPQAGVKDTIEALLLETDVLLAEPNAIHSSPEARKNAVWAIGSRSEYILQWAPEALRLQEAHRLSSGFGERVAILDTGIDLQHPVFAGRLLPGFDFVDFDPDPSEAGTPADAGFGHGTHVAGLVSMVAPNARIMPLRVLDAGGEGNAWVLAEAMLYAADPDGDPATDDGAHVINMSLGTSARTRLLESIGKLVSCAVPDPNEVAEDFSDPGFNDDKTRCNNFSGAVMVAAAGNDGSDAVREYPAAEGAYGLLAVAASNADARLANFSNFGSWVSVAAPGEGITSSVPGGEYGTWSGTSMAAPLAAGTAALVRSINPGMTPVDVVKRIELRSAALCGAKPREIDAAAAVQDAKAPDTICP